MNTRKAQKVLAIQIFITKISNAKIHQDPTLDSDNRRFRNNWEI